MRPSVSLRFRRRFGDPKPANRYARMVKIDPKNCEASRALHAGGLGSGPVRSEPAPGGEAHSCAQWNPAYRLTRILKTHSGNRCASSRRCVSGSAIDR